MGGTVRRNIERADPAVIDGLAQAGAATVHEAQGRIGLLAGRMRPIYPGRGSPARLSSFPPSRATIGWFMSRSSSSEKAMPWFWRRPATVRMAVPATRALTRGCRGLIIDAGGQDVRDLSRMGFPVWSRAVFAQGTVKATVGSVNVPILCAGAAIEPGDVVVADDDGICVVRRADAAAVLAKAQAREAKEEGVRQRLAAGELGLDIYGMRGKLEAMGLTYV